MTMACESRIDRIQELIDGVLGGLRRTELEQHLAECASCRALKAAAVDVAARAAVSAGATVVFLDNIPVAVAGDLAAAFDAVIGKARTRANTRMKP